MIRKIGLTGGMASGKSSVAARLAAVLHCERIDADEVCRRLLEPQAEGWREFTRVFGRQYVAEDGSLDRRLMRRELFADEIFRQEVNDLIHPLVKRTIIKQMDAIIGSGSRSRVLVEVPLLYEVHWGDLFDAVVVVYADYETCLKRLMARDSMERVTAVKEMESQLPLSEKAQKADYVIDNSGGPAATQIQVERLAALLRSNAAPVAAD